MSQRDLVDPELRGPLETLLAICPGGLGAIADPVARRARATALREQWLAGMPPDTTVRAEDRRVPGPPGAPDVPVRVYRPAGRDGEVLPGVLFVHGGGMVIGDLDSEDITARWLCREVGAVVVSSGYRKAPEHVHPAQLDDCDAALAWTVAHAAGLGLDPGRLAVVGGSAGGNLVLGLARRARDRGDVPAVRLAMAWYPMLDPRHLTPASREFTDVGFWDHDADVQAWAWFLGGAEPDADAAPALIDDVAGLPATFLDVGTVDLLRDDVIAFGARLAAAGVPLELHVHPGMFHAAETVAPDADLSHRVQAARLSALHRALAPVADG